ncbi:TetR family transcriptional regulator [Paraconexibacter sp. AEG42_29]|uniref:TetR family transcriptional regulator n=1 Tax=Paraconexibacter sp. AEG42_29 TaxID=2997339 RepID=UPI00339D3555
MGTPDARPSLTPVNPGRAAEARDAAIQLFAQRGYRGTTINDIADVMGIRGPSLYKHVTSKQAILRDIVVSTMDLLLEHQRDAIAASDDPAVQLREMTRAVVRDHVENRQRAYVCMRELASLESDARAEVQAQRDEYWHAARAVIKAGIATGVFDVRSSAVTTFCLIELASSPATWYDARSALSHAEIADQVAEMCLRLAGHRG